MIDDIRLESQKIEQAKTWDAIKSLEKLRQSEVIRMVLEGKHRPEDLDSAYRNMKKRIRELEFTHQLDMSQIVALRRQIEILMEGET